MTTLANARILTLTAVACLFVSVASHAQTQTPSEAFMAYRAALAKGTVLTDILPFLEPKGRAMLEKMPEPNQAKMFDFFKKFDAAFTGVTVTKETVTGDTAILDLSGKDAKGQPATRSVPMTKDATGWKVGNENWSSAPKRSGH